MNSPFPALDSCFLIRLQENTDPNGKHLEYKDADGTLFAKLAKVYHRTGLFGLFGLFSADHNVHGELKDLQGNMLLLTTSYRGDTKHDCKVEIHTPDGTLFGILRDAHYGVDFEGPYGTIVGKARRPEDRSTEPIEVTHTYSDASGEPVGTCERYYPQKSDSLLDLAMYGTTYLGQQAHKVLLTTPVEPVLHTFLFLFPALQQLRFARSEASE